MSKQISLVVTHYNETWDIVKPLFDSIAVQVDYDLQNLEVIIVNDGTGELTFPNNYDFEIRQLTPDKCGVSACRNLGLDNATGEYIMFCDCDDMFCSMFSLNVYDKAIKENPLYDLIRGSFIEDQFVEGSWKLIRHDMDIVFIHGKLWKREFLLENDIRFKNELVIHEDSYFNIIGTILAQGSTRETQVATYLWKFREDSVCRRESENFVFKTYKDLMKTRNAICESLEQRLLIDDLHRTVCKTILDSYYDFQKTEALKPENKELMAKAKKSFKKFYMRWKDIYKEVGIQDLANLMNLCRQCALNNGMRIEQQSLHEFITEIANL